MTEALFGSNAGNEKKKYGKLKISWTTYSGLQRNSICKQGISTELQSDEHRVDGVQNFPPGLGVGVL